MSCGSLFTLLVTCHCDGVARRSTLMSATQCVAVAAGVKIILYGLYTFFGLNAMY